MDLNHSPLFWYDTAGLFIQAGFLWFAASKVERKDWLYSLSFVSTSMLSVFSALWPVFDFETANIIRHCLHASTALSFASFSVMAWQDYKERGGQNSLFSFTFKVVGASFLGLVILAWLTVSALISLNGANNKKTERELSVIKQKAATASDVSVATYSIADTNRLMLMRYGERLGALEGKVDRLLVLVSGVPEIQHELWGVKKEMRQIRVDFSKRPTINLPPPTLKPRISSSIFLPVERVQPAPIESGKNKKKSN